MNSTCVNIFVSAARARRISSPSICNSARQPPADRPHRCIAACHRRNTTRASILHRRNRRAAGTPACVVDASGRRRRLFDALGVDQGRFLARHRTRRDTLRQPGASTRARNLAKTILRTHDPRRTRYESPYRLHPLEPGETRLGAAYRGLAMVVIPSLRARRRIARRLGKRIAVAAKRDKSRFRIYTSTVGWAAKPSPIPAPSDACRASRCSAQPTDDVA